MIRISEFIINKINIKYIKVDETRSDGYIWKVTYHLYIYFGKDDNIHLKTYDEDEYNEWLKLLEV